MTKKETFDVYKFDGDDFRDEWLAARRKGIGGSDAAAILGFNRYATPLTVWLQKTGRDETDYGQSEPAYWGTKIESVIRDEFSKRHPEFEIQDGTANMLINKERPWQLATLDGIVVDGKSVGVLEIKTCSEMRRSDWDDYVPDYYLPQVIHYMAVTGFDFAYVAVLIGGQEYREYKVDRDESDIKFLNDREAEFWKMVEDDITPAPTGNRCDTQALGDLHSKSTGEFVEVDVIKDLDRLQELKKQEATIKLEIDEINNNLRAQIGDAKGLVSPTHKVTWLRCSTKKFNASLFKSENPAIADKYSTVSNQDRGLRIKEIK